MRSQRYRSITFLVVLTFLTGACAQSLRVDRVIDGDTFELSDGRTVRLIGIDTPETYNSSKLRRDAKRSGRDVETIKALGRAASSHAEQLVEGKRVELEYDPANTAQNHQDRYSRTLAYVWVLDSNGRRLYNVNERLIRDGYANAYTQYPFEQKDRYLRLQRNARRHERGLWAKVDLSTPTAPHDESQPAPRTKDRDCDDFDTRAEAQRFFDAQGPEDPHQLDGDGNGQACEGLP